MIITIARQCGCGALNVGKVLSEHYGIPLYTRKSLLDMAGEKGMTDEMSSFFEERPVDELMSAVTDFQSEREVVRGRFCRAFTDMVGKEDCIVIGRCGNYIFRERPDLVSVFLHGSIDLRIAAIAEEEHLSRAAAEEFVRTVDDCRVSYHRFYTGLVWGNAADYDICLDSCRLGVDATAVMIENFIGRI